MNETINNLITRRSVRSFQKEQISEEQLNEILTAGTYAASGNTIPASIYPNAFKGFSTKRYPGNRGAGLPYPDT